MSETDRRVLSWATSKEQADKRLESYPGARVEEVDGHWAVTADKPTKGS